MADPIVAATGLRRAEASVSRVPEGSRLSQAVSPQVLRFGPFELDAASGEIRKDGAPIKLRQQPFTVLALLASQPGRVFTREEIQLAVWGPDTHIDYEQGINYCIKEIRAALGDQSDSPVYVQTLARRGYRFIAPVEKEALPPELPAARLEPRTWSRKRLLVGSGAALAVAIALGLLLPRGGRVTPPPPPLILAVLPFENLSGDPEQDYFSEGLTEEMIAQLGRLQPGRLSVVARTVARGYRKRDHPVDALGQELGARYVLEGSVRSSGDRVIVTSRLIRVEDKNQVWSETFEAELKDIVEVQTMVARAVATGVQLSLSPGEQARLRRAARVDPEAYRLYLRGRYFWNRWTVAGLRRSIDRFEEAIRRQPDYALAHAGLADAYIALADQSPVDPGDVRIKARQAAQRALDLDDSLAEAHASMGMVLASHDFSWTEGEAELRRAIDLNPSYATARHWYSHVLRATGRLDEALAQVQLAEDAAPLSLIVVHNVGMVRLNRGELDQAVERFRAALDMDPDFPPALLGLGRAYLAQGKGPQAVEVLERVVRLTEGNARYEAALAYSYAVTGRVPDARRMLARLERGSAGRAYDIATVYAGLGEGDAALASLAHAEKLKDPALRGLPLDERLRSLRSRPEWPALLAGIGLPGPGPVAMAARIR